MNSQIVAPFPIRQRRRGPTFVVECRVSFVLWSKFLLIVMSCGLPLLPSGVSLEPSRLSNAATERRASQTLCKRASHFYCRARIDLSQAAWGPAARMQKRRAFFTNDDRELFQNPRIEVLPWLSSQWAIRPALTVTRTPYGRSGDGHGRTSFFGEPISALAIYKSLCCRTVLR